MILSAFEAMDWAHTLLIGGCVIGGVLVGVGIIKEAEKWSFPVILVLIGVILEAIFMIALFVYDENITHEQQSVILTQNKEIIGLRKLTAARDITLDDVKRASAKLVKYSCQPAKIVVFPVNFESDWIAGRVYEILLDAHWKLMPPERLSAAPGNGGFMVSGIWVDHSDDQKSLEAADDLRNVLNSTIAVTGGRREGPGVVPGTFDPTSPIVWIFVGDKPVPLSSWVTPKAEAPPTK